MEYVNISILSMLLTYIDTHHLRLSDNFSIDVLNLHNVQALETMNDIYLWFKQQFTEVFSLTQGKNTAEIQSYHIREVIKAIQSGYSGNLSLEVLAEKAGLHKVYLNRLFKKETGRTCYEYIQNVRIKKAQELLLNTSITITGIAEQTGFTSYDQFAVVFKKLTGETPSLYRKKYK
jgi:two-component system response regulator YesN